MAKLKKKVLCLFEEEIKSLLSLKEAIIAVEKSFAAFNSGKAILPGVINLDLSQNQGEVHVKGAYLEGDDLYIIKIASGFYLNPSLGLPVGNGLILAFSAKTGNLEALLFDRGYLTEIRTAAAGAVAAKYLSRSSLERVAIIGSGTQARFQLKALALVRSFSQVAVWSRQPENVNRYLEEMKIAFPATRFMAATSPEKAIKDADLIITATPSRNPIVRAEWLVPGVHITAVGSDGPEKQELFPEVLIRADLIYADSIKQASFLGEIHHALKNGLIDEHKITGEIGEIILGQKPARTSENQITIADLTGLGVQDAAVSTLVLEKAAKAGVGHYLEI
ncbi:MAG: ornithine cyclodeaminase family protein [Candidatus Aminicenantes bacterium]|nr:ornithine cyclodeaminase family protein [Candidatus Aminicenantes bacterium]